MPKYEASLIVSYTVTVDAEDACEALLKARKIGFGDVAVEHFRYEAKELPGS